MNLLTYCLDTGWAPFQWMTGCSHFLFAKDFFDLGENRKRGNSIRGGRT